MINCCFLNTIINIPPLMYDNLTILRQKIIIWVFTMCINHVCINAVNDCIVFNTCAYISQQLTLVTEEWTGLFFKQNYVLIYQH